MTARNPAARGKADSNQPAIKQAIEALGYPVMDLSAAGGGVEDLLVGISRMELSADGSRVVSHYWVPVECKVRPISFTEAQLKWRARTHGWPRITAVSAQDAVDQLRRMTG
ncbi:MAG: hypothetical protein RL685_4600 [Pseudomonadota bacterium]|jgi:hypothetical protein